MKNKLWKVVDKQLYGEIQEVESCDLILEDFDRELLERIVLEHNVLVTLSNDNLNIIPIMTRWFIDDAEGVVKLALQYGLDNYNEGMQELYKKDESGLMRREIEIIESLLKKPFNQIVSEIFNKIAKKLPYKRLSH